MICVEKHVSGSYCLSSHSQLQYIEREGDWEPKPSKGILISKGNPKSVIFKWSFISLTKILCYVARKKTNKKKS